MGALPETAKEWKELIAFMHPKGHTAQLLREERDRRKTYNVAKY